MAPFLFGCGLALSQYYPSFSVTVKKMACKVKEESINNLSTIEKSNVQSETTSLLDLSDFVLLRVFSLLDLRDAIKFAGTCVRLNRVSEMHFTKYKQFDLLKFQHFFDVLDPDNYYARYAYDDEEEDDQCEDDEEIEKPEPIDAAKVLAHIGKHITTLSIHSTPARVRRAIKEHCVNIKSLKIYDLFYGYYSTDEWEAWMKKVNLESLTLAKFDNFDELSVRLSSLKELKFTDGGVGFMELYNILENTPDLESLQVELYYPDFDYRIFNKLPKLRCLDIKIYSADLVKLIAFLKMDALTQLKLFLPVNLDAVALKRLNSFLETLAESARLDELQLYVNNVDKDTFGALNLFRVTSLHFCAEVCEDDRCLIHELVNAQPNLKHLDLLRTDLSIELVVFVIKSLVKLETLSLTIDTGEFEQFNESEVDEILKTSISRPTLTMYINSGDRSSVKIVVRSYFQHKFSSFLLILIYRFES